jgi:hypothetical protein
MFDEELIFKALGDLESKMAMTRPEQNNEEGFARATWEIEPTGAGFCRVTVTHELESAPL